MGETGLEPVDVTSNVCSNLVNVAESSAANALQIDLEALETDPDLMRLIHAWPTLEDQTKRQVLATVETAAVVEFAVERDSESNR